MQCIPRFTISPYPSLPPTPSAPHPGPSTSLNLGVVITGGSNGVGYAYADEFLSRGHAVVICDVADTAPPVAALKKKHPSGSIFGTKCDVSSSSDVMALGAFAKDKLGTVHHWINNAGVNGGRRALMDVPIEQVELVVKVNLLGVLLCTKQAMSIMSEQSGVEGHIFNTVGSGVKGGGTPGYACYGATKRGLPQLTDSLRKEIDEGVEGYEEKKMKGTIKVHSLSPGMVFTKVRGGPGTAPLPA